MPCFGLGQRTRAARTPSSPSASAPPRGSRAPRASPAACPSAPSPARPGNSAPPIDHSRAAATAPAAAASHLDPPAHAVRAGDAAHLYEVLRRPSLQTASRGAPRCGESCAPLPVQCLTRSMFTRSDSRPCRRLRVVEPEPLDEFLAGRAPRIGHHHVKERALVRAAAPQSNHHHLEDSANREKARIIREKSGLWEALDRCCRFSDIVPVNRLGRFK